VCVVHVYAFVCVCVVHVCVCVCSSEEYRLNISTRNSGINLVQQLQVNY